jgi:GxxExxY protein
MNQPFVKHKELSYEVMKCCFAVHNYLGSGFLEIVHKDALEIEFERAGIPYSRERKYEVLYKGLLLPHYFTADFVIDEKIILEVKGQSAIIDMYIAQALNYLNVSNKDLAIIAAFGSSSLLSKRLVK